MHKSTNKIGIMTMHSIPNYGAIMQAYATVEIIRKLSKREFNDCFIPEIIDYQPINKKKRYSIQAFIEDSVSSPSRFASNLIHFEGVAKYRNSKKLHKKAYAFYKSVNVLSDEVLRKNLKEVSANYVALLVGSDQVWNPYGMDKDKSYLLEFCDNNKRYAFSSSFGISVFPDIFKEVYAEELSKFQKVSLREKEGIDIFRTLTGRSDCVITLDPTLLLNQDDYNRLENEDILNQVGKEYSLVYFAKKSKTLAEFALKNTSEKRKIVFIGMPGEIPDISTIGNHIIRLDVVSPGEFLVLFHFATDVFTNSFHGIAFSVIYKKQFWIEYNNQFSKSNSRLENIVELLSLQKHVIGSEEYDRENIIDYFNVEHILKKEQQKGEKIMVEILDQIKITSE